MATAAVVRPSIIANEFEDVALIGGGSGITPLYQLIDHALNDPTNRTRFTLLYANVTEADILLRDELAALQRAHPTRFKIVHSLDNPPVSGWSGASGYVSRELIKPKRAISSRCSYAVGHHRLHLHPDLTTQSVYNSSVLTSPFSFFVSAFVCALCDGRNRPAGTGQCGRGEKGWYEAGRDRRYPQGARIH